MSQIDNTIPDGLAGIDFTGEGNVEQQQDTVAVSVDKEAIKKVLKEDAESFINFFIGGFIAYDVPQFHIDIFNKMISRTINKFVCAIPRGHAKTTLAKLACIWYFLFSPYRFIIYLSNTATVAQAACQDIVAFLESDNFKAIFGEVEWMIRREGDGLYKFKLLGKICILRALGANQQVRGINIDNQRPQLAIVDDLEDAETISTVEGYKKLKRWFYGTFLKCLDKFNNKLVQIGNMIAIKCLLKDHCQSVYWHSVRLGCLLQNGQPLWPDLWPIAKLKEDFNEYLMQGEIDTWMAEMMNQPLATADSRIRPNEITHRPQPTPEELEFCFIVLDPALSKERWGHKAAITVHGFFEDKWQIVDSWTRKGADPIELFNQIVRLAQHWNVVVVGIESIQYQSALRPIYTYLCETKGIENILFVELYSQRQKVARIGTWIGWLKKGEYALNDNEVDIVSALTVFDPMKKDQDDDLLDSAAYGVQMVDMYIYDIVEAKNLMHKKPARVITPADIRSI